MKQSLKIYLNIFNLTGISLKSFERKKSFLKNVISIWSYVMFLLFWLSLGGTVYLRTHATVESVKGNVFLKYSFYNFCISFLVMIALTMKKKNVEENFWNLVKEAEIIFKYRLRTKINVKKFNLRCWLKIFLPVIVCTFVMTASTVIIFTKSVEFYPFFFVSLLYSHLFIIKFVFYVTVLRFWLNEIKVKLSQENLSMIEIKTLKKAYTLCWKMCSMINEIFGWGLLTRSSTVFISTLPSGYALIIGTAPYMLKPHIIFTFATNIITMLLVCESCQECIDCLAFIAPLVVKKSSKDFHALTESFTLQLLHQRIGFEPLKIYSINYETLTSVSFLKEKIHQFLRITSLTCRRLKQLFFL